LTECERWCQLDDREIAAGKKWWSGVDLAKRNRPGDLRPM
jgi:hypothetical protein